MSKLDSIFENLILKLPHPILTAGATFKSWQLDRKRRSGNYNALSAKYDFSKYFDLSWEDSRSYQLQRLRELLVRAYSYVPYYNDITSYALQLEDLDQLRDLPFLTKQQARMAGNGMMNQQERLKPHYVGHTSGSTGTPFEFHWTYDTLRTRYAMRDNFYKFHGCDFDRDRNIRVGGRLFVDVSKTSPPFWIFDRITNQLMFSIYHMSSKTMKSLIDPIERYKPDFVTGYPSGIYLFARFCKEIGYEFFPKAVFTDSETVLDYQRELIEDVWQCPVHDYLGMEAGWVAGQCRQGKYHLSPLTSIVEIIDDEGNPQSPGEIGEIVVTDLVNELMPLIRYRTGDTARWSSTSCGCGWNTPTLERIEGRVDDIVVLPSGRKVGRLDHIFKNARNIRECQIIQEKIDYFVFRVVPDQGYDDTVAQKLLEEAWRRLGEDVTIEIQLVDEIERTSRGKFRSVISKVKID